MEPVSIDVKVQRNTDGDTPSNLKESKVNFKLFAETKCIPQLTSGLLNKSEVQGGLNYMSVSMILYLESNSFVLWFVFQDATDLWHPNMVHFLH